MNLENSPSFSQLIDIFSSCDDQAGHHVLWVSRSGDVNMGLMSSDSSPHSFDPKNPDIFLRYETFRQGSGLVGKAASKNKSFLDRIFRSLLSEWSSNHKEAGQIYIDSF